MKLDLDILMDYLPAAYQAKRLGPQSKKRDLNQPFLFEPGCNMTKGNLYITRQDSMPKSPPEEGIAFICIGDGWPNVWQDNRIQVIVVPGQHSVAEVFNTVQSIFARFNKWDSDLLTELGKLDFEFESFFQTGLDVLENALALTTSGFQSTFHTECRNGKNGTRIFSISSQKQNYTLERAENIRKNTIPERQIVGATFSTSYNTTKEDFAHCYCRNLLAFNHYVGCVTLGDEYKPFKKSDFQLADHFFSYCEEAYTRYLQKTSVTSSPIDSAIHKLLSRNALNTCEYELLTLTEGEEWICFKLEGVQTDIAFFHKDNMCSALCVFMQGKTYAVMRGDDILGLLKAPMKDEDKTEVLALFEDILSRLGYIAGLSNSFVDIMHLADYMKQADFAVAISCKDKKANTLYYFGEHILDFLMHVCRESAAPQAICTKGLQALLDYDQKKGTEYLRTLQVYLENESNISQTSAALFIHRSSLFKRLNRVKKLTGDDIDNPEVRLYYRIWFQIQKQLDLLLKN